MKKSLLALGATTLVAGLGLATSAQAVYFFGQGFVDQSASNTYKSVVTAAQGVELNPGATGHGLLVPYYSAQGNTATLLSIVNTDTTNGKAVKVRFRGAANSDDVLDFTLFLSPFDVWTAQISQNANGTAQLSTGDTSCTLPTSVNSPFLTGRLAGLTATQQAANTLEGYVEIINEADIPPQLGQATVWTQHAPSANSNAWPNALYNAIKHTNGVAPCEAQWTGGLYNGRAAMNDVLLNFDNPPADASGSQGATLLADAGLSAPTGQLAGSWALIDQQTQAQFSGNDIALRGYATASTGTTIGSTGYAAVAFSPQMAGQPPQTLVNATTADPLLTGGYAAGGDGETSVTLPATPTSLIPQWVDLPDVSTPMGPAGTAVAQTNDASGFITPTAQAYTVANAIGKTRINNEFWNDPTGTNGVPLNTDWIISQPTRRYFAAVSYATFPKDPQIVYNDGQTSHIRLANGIVDPLGTFADYAHTTPTTSPATVASLPYAGGLAVNSTNGAVDGGLPNSYTNLVTPALGAGNLTLVKGGTFGPQACLTGGNWTGYDREEGVASGSGSQLSPITGTSNPFCGEVAVISWGQSPTSAALTKVAGGGTFKAGWATFVPTIGTGATFGLPLIGFAALSGDNQQSGHSVGATLPFRW